MKNWFVRCIAIGTLISVLVGCGAVNSVSIMEGSDPTQGGVYTPPEDK